MKKLKDIHLKTHILKKANINGKDWRSTKVKLTVSLVSLTQKHYFYIHTGAVTGSFLKSAKAIFLCLSLQLMFIINGFVSIQLLWKLLDLYCLYPSSTHMFIEIWVWPHGCTHVSNKVIFQQSTSFAELISQNRCIKNSILKNFV